MATCFSLHQKYAGPKYHEISHSNLGGGQDTMLFDVMLFDCLRFKGNRVWISAKQILLGSGFCEKITMHLYAPEFKLLANLLCLRNMPPEQF